MVNLFGPETIAACIVEPIAGSTGTLVPPQGYLTRLREICDQYHILLVFDEVITGFGRTGKAFAGHSFGVIPDMMTMAKAITNGAQPMGAVAVRESIYNTIVESAPQASVELFHGYTYSGHPAACAAGLAMLDIIEKDRLFERAEAMSDYFLDSLWSALEDIPVVTDIRGFGMLGGFDVAADGGPGKRGYNAQVKFYHAGLHVKFTGDAGIVAPPFVAEKQHIDEMCGIMRDVLKQY
jgi:beta-alanine--pyruvate transaminase